MKTKSDRARAPDSRDWVSASDIGQYVFCAHSYWLSAVQGVRPTGKGASRLKKGVKNHRKHGHRYDWQRRIWRVGVALFVVGLVALVGMLWFMRAS